MRPPTMRPQKSNQAASSSLWDVLCLVIVEPVKVEDYKSTLGRGEPRVNASLHGLATSLMKTRPYALSFSGFRSWQ